MTPQLRKLLDELYALDPTLASREAELVAILTRLTDARPDARIDEAFIKRLRNELAARPAPRRSLLDILHPMTSKTPFLIGGLAATALLLFIINAVPPTTPSQTADSGAETVGLAMGSVPMAPRAFGDLGGLAAVAAPQAAPTAEHAVLGTEAAISARPQSGGGGGGVGLAADAKMLIAPWPQGTFAMTYAGDPITVAESDGDVHRRVADAASMTRLANALTGQRVDLFDLGTLRDLRVERVSLYEARPDGYAMELNLADGSLYMGLDWRNYRYDPTMDQPLSPSELPSDATLIAVADAFMDRFSMDRGAYGAPEVDRSWERYVIAGEAGDATVPPTIAVVYPLLVDGMRVSEFGGEVAGPRVHIRVRDRAVTNLTGIVVRSFERSSYALETDPERLRTFAEKGGLRGPAYLPYDGSIKEGTLRLGTPERIMLKMFHTVNDASAELYLPALRFPVMDAPAQQYYAPQDVIVPLVKDILDAYERSMSQPPIIMPFSESGEPDPAASEPAVLR